MVLSMLLFGGPTLHYFALALTIGILFGIYSSVFVAAAIAMWLGVKREDLVKSPPREGRRSERSERRGGGVESPERARTGHYTLPMATPANSVGTGHAGAARLTASGCSTALPAVVQGDRRGGRDAADAAGRRAGNGAQAPRCAEPTTADACPAPGCRHSSTALRNALVHGRVVPTRPGDLPLAGRGRAPQPLSLVDDDTIEREILSSRLALAMMDRASWEFTDLRSRMIDAREARGARHQRRAARRTCWRASSSTRGARAGSSLDAWRALQTGAARRVRAASPKRRTTRPTAGWSQHRVLPEVDLRPFIRRVTPRPAASAPPSTGFEHVGPAPRCACRPRASAKRRG